MDRRAERRAPGPDSHRSDVTTRTRPGWGSCASRRTISSSAASALGLGAVAISITVDLAAAGASGVFEHDDDVLAFGRGPVLQQSDESEHRGITVAPPAVRAGADHVHAIDVPTHPLLAFSRRSAVGIGRRRSPPPLDVGALAFGALPATLGRGRRPRLAARRGDVERGAQSAACKRSSASSRLRAWLRSSLRDRGHQRTQPVDDQVASLCRSNDGRGEQTSKLASIREAVTFAC